MTGTCQADDTILRLIRPCLMVPVYMQRYPSRSSDHGCHWFGWCSEVLKIGSFPPTTSELKIDTWYMPSDAFAGARLGGNNYFCHSLADPLQCPTWSSFHLRSKLWKRLRGQWLGPKLPGKSWFSHCSTTSFAGADAQLSGTDLPVPKRAFFTNLTQQEEAIGCISVPRVS